MGGGNVTIMKIEVRLFATLRQHLPQASTGGKVALEIEDGLPVVGLIQKLGIDPTLAPLILVNGVDIERDQDRVLQDGDTVSMFPPLAGGSVSLPSPMPA